MRLRRQHSLTLIAALLLVIPAAAAGSQHVEELAAALTHTTAPDRAARGDVAGLDVEKVTLEEALRALTANSGVPIAYSPSLLPHGKLVTCGCMDVSVDSALRTLLRGTELEVASIGDQLLIRQKLALVSSGSAARAAPPASFRSLTTLGSSEAGTPAGRRAERAGARQGVVVGTVLDAVTQRPIASVQVFVLGTGLGTLTNSQGQYRLANVPAGEVTIVAEMVGYGSERHTLTVRSGETVSQDFLLRVRAISLDEVVVTGLAGATERRRLGTTISSIHAGEITATQPIFFVDQLLQGRVSAMSVLTTSGTVGTGSRIQVRGLVSVSQKNTPLIYIDGVSVDNSKEDAMTGGQGLSRLQDLPVGDIAKIEVIKGAAATTLYGTEASAGVIQIFTKSGHVGAPQFTANLDYGMQRIPNRFQANSYTEFVGPDGFQARNPLDQIQTGHHQGLRLEVRGGSEGVHYFLSGDVKREEGSLTPEQNQLKQVSMRANLTALPTERLSIKVNSGYSRSDLTLPPSDNAIEGIVMNLFTSVPYQATETRPWGEPFTPYSAIEQIDTYQGVHRFTGGITVDYLAREDLRNTLVLGLDWVDQENSQLFPFGYTGPFHGKGRRQKWDRTFSKVTVDYRTIFSAGLTERTSLQAAVGAQGIFSNDRRTFGQGDVFPAPGVTTIGTAARTRANEILVGEVNAGLFGEGTVGLRDRLFLTAGLRFDGNSAFGDEFDTQLYPKVSAAYNISDDAFWPTHLIPTAKLRVAWGTSGLAPAQFAADRTYAAVSALEGQPAVTPGNLGDPLLAPEKSSEIELGFDAGLLDDRVGLTMTYFHQTTTDALIPAQFPPSSGFLQPQLKNIGSIRNTGVETNINALLLSGRRFSLSTNVHLAWQSNKVLDMGGSAPIRRHVIDQQQVREGFAVDGFWAPSLLRWDAEARRHIYSDTLEYHGSASPSHFGSLSLSSDLGARLTLGGMFEWATGHFKNNVTRYFQIAYRTGDEYLATVERPRGIPTAASDSLLDLIGRGGIGTFIEPADFLKLREVSLNYRLPPAWLGAFGVDNASIRVAARNLVTFTKFSGVDPEVTWDGRDGFNTGAEFNTMPLPRRLTFSIQTTF